MRTLLRLTWAFPFLALGAVAAHAQPYPSRQVQIIVAYPAGGAADLIVRSVASRLTQTWGQQIVIENRAGGGTQIADRSGWQVRTGRPDLARYRHGNVCDQSFPAFQAVLRHQGFRAGQRAGVCQPNAGGADLVAAQ